MNNEKVGGWRDVVSSCGRKLRGRWENCGGTLWVHPAVSEEPLGASERRGPEQQGDREDAEIQGLYMIFSSPNERLRSSGTSEPGYLEAELGLFSGS